MIKLYKLFLNFKYMIQNLLNYNKIKQRNQAVRTMLENEAKYILAHFEKKQKEYYARKSLSGEFRDLFIKDYVRLYYQDVVDRVDMGDKVRYATFYKYLFIREHPTEMEIFRRRYNFIIDVDDYIVFYKFSSKKDSAI